MPFIHMESQLPGVTLGAWSIEEDELYFLERVKLYENEWTRLAQIAHPQKRLEWLSSRLCLKELLKIANTTRVESLSTATGKPYLSNNQHHISYTHSTHYSAAIAGQGHEVGVDIEYRHRKRNLRTRFLFMSDEELDYFEPIKSFELFLLIWSAKETLYKLLGEGHAFKHHLHMQLKNFQLADNGMLPAIVSREGVTRSYEVYYHQHTDFILTYTGERMLSS
jgi:phosphopantetheinyl transferase